MKAFHTIAVPHHDIMDKKLTMDVFAADLWDTFKGDGSEEYTDSKTFFKKTHITKNLQDILDDVRDRLQGRGGDGFLHIETPFGGGKTHAMIALYHKAAEWGAKPVVIVGTAMSPEDTVWGMIEGQLNGKVDKLSGRLAPGREKIREVLEMHGPILILIDELLSYIGVLNNGGAEHVKLANQTITFIQQLSELMSSSKRICVVASFPASSYEMVDRESAEDLLLRLSKVAGRKERKITPVRPDDVPNIIRARLFSTPENEIRRDAEEIVSKLVDYCEREAILPPRNTAKQYRERFQQTYPFLPEVIDTLYHNWGSYSRFQRTRGVLRLLSLVVYSLKDSEKPYITLADFDLNDDGIRRELLEHIGNEFDSVVTKDITGTSGAVRAEQEVGDTYRGLRLGTRIATTIFMYSFSAGGTNGAAMNQIKMAASKIDIPSSVVGDIVAMFKSKLSYFKSENDRYLFSSEPNINRLKLDRMENISGQEVRDGEKLLLEKSLGDSTLRTIVWPASIKDVEDSPMLKLVVLDKDDQQTRENILNNKGDAIPRVYRNSIFFLCPSQPEKRQFVEHLKSASALKKILADSSPNLRDEQKRDVVSELQEEESSLPDALKKYYRNLYVPCKIACKKYEMGIPTFGESGGISQRVFKRLIAEQQIHEKIGALILEQEYLRDAKFVKTAPIYEIMLSTRGNRRPVNRDVIERSIMDGVEKSMFGLGELLDGRPACKFFCQSAPIAFADNEVIIHDSLCKEPHNPPPPPPRKTLCLVPAKTNPVPAMDLLWTRGIKGSMCRRES